MIQNDGSMIVDFLLVCEYRWYSNTSILLVSRLGEFPWKPMVFTKISDPHPLLR